jgi:hypothetical protein
MRTATFQLGLAPFGCNRLIVTYWISLPGHRPQSSSACPKRPIRTRAPWGKHRSLAKRHGLVIAELPLKLNTDKSAAVICGPKPMPPSPPRRPGPDMSTQLIRPVALIGLAMLVAWPVHAQPQRASAAECRLGRAVGHLRRHAGHRGLEGNRAERAAACLTRKTKPERTPVSTH